MNCPICQAELTPVHLESEYDSNKLGCPNTLVEVDGHGYTTSTTHGLVESYIYRDYRIHTAPLHPTTKTPRTTIYPFPPNPPDLMRSVYDVNQYLTWKQIKEKVDQLVRQLTN